MSVNFEFSLPMQSYTWYVSDQVEVVINNVSNYEEAQKELEDFLLNLKSGVVTFEKGHEVYIKNENGGNA